MRLFSAARTSRVNCTHGHIPVLAEEVLHVFSGRRLDRFVDGTLGAGGHSLLVLKNHPEMVTFVGFDRDRNSLDEASSILKKSVEQDAKERSATPPAMRFVHDDFRRMEHHLVDIGKVDGILLDLGMSSMQVDSEERGFSFLHPLGALDMRMDQSKGRTAKEVVNTCTEEELGRIIREYGEERRWKDLARRIVHGRNEKLISTVGDLLQVLGMERGQGVARGKRKIHPATRLFQALRIAVNDELGAVEEILPSAIDLLAPGGRLCVISFHSLEDRIVKNSFKQAAGNRAVDADWQRPSLNTLPRNLRLHMPEEESTATVRLVTKKPTMASDEEKEENPRSRSAKLRAVEKL